MLSASCDSEGFWEGISWPLSVFEVMVSDWQTDSDGKTVVITIFFSIATIVRHILKIRILNTCILLVYIHNIMDKFQLWGGDNTIII